MIKKVLYTSLITISSLLISTSVEASSRPQVGYIMRGGTQYVDFPGGCGYYLDNWSDGVFAAGGIGDSVGELFFMYIDGRARYLETIYKTDGLLIAKDSTYEASVETPNWNFDGWETSTAKATLRVTNMRTGASSNLIVQAQEGC